MALTEKHLEARAAVLAQDAIGYGSLPKHDGHQPAIHGEHLGFVREAMVGTALSWPDGGSPHDELRNALMETWWGQGIHNLYTSSGPGAEGWQRIPGRGLRAPWWSVQRHERATEKLVGLARCPPYLSGSVEAVPGLSSAWPISGLPPASEAIWLVTCRDAVLHAEQYAALRVSLGLPVDPETPPVEPPVEPPEPEPVDPYVLKLRGGRFEARVQFTEKGLLKHAPAVPLPQFADVSGAFYFYSPDNAEIFVKLLGPSGGKYWVYAAALSDQEFCLSVTDTKTGDIQAYANAKGEFTGLARDTEAFEA